MFKQKTIDFSAGDRLGVIREAVLPRAAGKVTAHVLKHVLRQIHDFGARSGVCWASQDTIAASCGLGVRTVQRAISELVARSILVCERRRPVASEQGDRRTTNHYAICWGTLATLTPRVRRDGASASGVSAASADPFPPADQHANGADQHASGADQHASGAPLSMYEENEERRTAATAKERWQGVRDVLATWKDFSGPASLIAAAEAARLDPDEMLSVLREFDANRAAFRGYGALLHRVRLGEWPALVATVQETAVAARASSAAAAAKAAETRREAIVIASRNKINQLLRAGWPRPQIEAELRGRGVPEEVIREHFGLLADIEEGSPRHG